MSTNVPVSLGIVLPPVLMISGLFLLVMGLYRAPLTFLIAQSRQRHVQPPTYQKLKVPLPSINDQQVFVGAIIGGAISTMIGTYLLQTVWLIIAIPVLAFLCGMTILAILEQQQQRQLTRQLIAASAEVAAALNSDMTLNASLKKVAATVPQPLATPWQWMVDTAGSSVMTADGTAKFLQIKDTARAVASQTRNRTFLRFLEHLEGASDLPQASARDRMQSANDALYASQLREQQVRAKLAHARGSAITVVSVGLGIALFLRSAMAPQWEQAFSGTWGLIAACFFGMIFLTPIIAIFLLSRSPDVDF